MPFATNGIAPPAVSPSSVGAIHESPATKSYSLLLYPRAPCSHPGGRQKIVLLIHRFAVPRGATAPCGGLHSEIRLRRVKFAASGK